MKNIIGIIFILLLAIGGGYMYVSQQVKVKPLPQYVVEAENALAMKEAVIIGHMNFNYIVKLESKLYGEGDPSPLLNNEKAPDFIQSLEANGINIREQLQHIIGAFYATDKGNGFATLLFGKFNPEQIIKTLEKTYTVTKQSNSNLITFVHKNKKTCQLSKPITVDITQNRITITSPNIMPKILDRLTKKSTAELDLTAWKSFRETRLASLGFLVPKDSANALPNGLMRNIVRSAVKKNMPVTESMFIGASVHMSPSPAIAVEMELNTDNNEWIKTSVEKIEKGREKFRTDSADFSPSLANLDNYLTVLAKEKQLNITLNLNKQVLEDIQNIIQETISSFFSISVFSNDNNNEKLDDKIIPAEQLPVFFDNYTYNDITNYNDSSYHFLKADTTSGPFGIMLEKVELIDKDGKKTAALTFKVESEPLRNIPIEGLNSDGTDGAAATFKITGIYDANNNSLLAKEDCGRDRNTEAAALNIRTSYAYKDGKNISFNYLEGKKTVRLANGANTNRIAKIEGNIILNLPTDIKVKKFKAPLEKQSLQTKNMRLFFKKSNDRQLNYEISGKKNHILAIQALNIDGKPLASNSGSASSSMFSNGIRSVNKDIQGTVTGAEVTYTTDSVSKTYNFNITSFLNHYDKKTWGKKPIAVKPDRKENFAKYISIYNFSDFCDKNTTALSLPPFQLCLHSISYLGKHWGADLRFSLAAPNSPALNKNLFGTEIRIEQLKIKDDNNNITSVKFPMSGYLLLNKTNKKKDKRAFLKAQQQPIRTPDLEGLLESKGIVGAKGKIIIRLPKHLKSRGMYANLLNSNMTTDDKKLILFVSEIAYDSLTITAAGDIGKLVQIIPITKDKKPLPLDYINIEKKNDIYLIKLKPVGGTPEFLNVVYAVKQDKFAIPFNIMKP